MRHKIILFCCFLGLGFSNPLFSQSTGKSFLKRIFSPDSLRTFDESAWRMTALSDGYIGDEFNTALYLAKRQHIINVYYPNAYDIAGYKVDPGNNIFNAPCVNEGFESGNFTGWTLTQGSNTNSCAYPTATTALFPGPTCTVLTTPLVDPVTGVVIPNSPLGGSMVAKLNNTSVGGKVIKIAQNFIVTNGNYLYDFAYYGIQNGVHPCCQQPYMFVRLRDCVGNLLACPNFSFNTPGGGCPGTGPGSWINTGIGAPNTVYRSNGWQKYSIDLTQYIGTCITVEVMVADCSPTGHYLYTYFDSNCNTMNLGVNGGTVSMPSQTVTPQVLCGTTATLTAPSGLSPYVWNGPPLSGVTNNTNQTISTSVPGNYSLVMTPIGVCTPITRIVNLTFAPPATITANPPGGMCIGGTTTLTASGALNYTWSPGGANTTTIAVSPTVTTIYSLTAQTGTCSGTFTTQVVVNPSPTVNIVASSSSVCSAGTTSLTASGANTYTWSTGATGSVVVVNPTVTTTYSVVGLSLSGCTATSNILITVVPTPTSFVTIVSPTVICIGGTANLVASAIGALTYTWFPGPIVGNFVSVSPTITTQYTVVGANGSCTNSAVASLSVDPGPSLTVAASPTAICPGGSSTLTASGAVSYTWNPMGVPLNTVVVSPTITTIYTVTGASGLGCTSTKTISQIVSPVPSITISPASPSICIGTSGTLTASGAASYTWNPGGLTTTSIVVSPTINTTYTIIGSNGTCTSSTTSSLTVVPVPTVIAAGSTPSICSGSSATLTSVGATTYTWNPGALTGSNVVVSPTITTTYTVIGSSGGCSSSATVALTVNNGPTLTAIANPTNVCAGNSSTLSSSGALSYTWNPGALAGGTVTVTPPSSTTYSVIGSNIFGCTTTQTVSLTITPNPTITVVASSPSICIGGSATLTANGATSYTWNPGALTGSNVVVSPIINTTYTVTGNSLGCTGQKTISIIVVPLPTVTAVSSPTAICSGNSATLTAAGAATYTWNPGALTGSNVVVSPTINTTYTLIGNNGACNATTTVALIVNPNPTITANASPTAVCVTGNVTLTATGAVGYTWNPGVLAGATVVVTPTITTIYTVTGVTALGCTSTKTTNLVVNSVPVLTLAATPTAICNGSSSTLTALGAISYTWNPGALTGSNVVVSPTITTVYTITGSNGGCSATSTLSLIVNPNPTITATASPTNVCAGNSSTLTGLGAVSYTWNPGALIGNTVSVSPTITTIYTLTGATALGCTSTKTVNLIVTPNPTVTANASPTAICIGGVSTLTASGAITYTWNPGALTGTNIVVSPTTTTIYTVTGANGLCNNTKTVSVIVNPTPTLNTTANPTAICLGGSSTLTVLGGNTYTWNPGALTGSNVVVTPTTTTTYTVIGASVFGCTSTAVKAVTVNPLPTLTVTSSNTNICAGASATLTGSGGITYTWNPGAITGSTIAVTPSITTTYTLTGANLLGCVNTKTFTQVVTPIPTITAAASPTAICIGGNSTLTASGALSYSWNPGALTGTNVVVSPTTTTIYTVTGANGLCNNTQTVSVLVNPTPTLTTGASPSIICNGASITLTVTGAATYTWNPGVLTGSNVVVTPTINTTYTVLGASAFGCTSTAVRSVTVNPLPTLTISSTNTNICSGTSATLTGSGGVAYIWNPGGVVGATISVSPTITTTYTLTGTSGLGCLNTATFTQSVTPTPTVSAVANASVICSGASSTLTANGATSYTWNPGALTGTSIVVTPTVSTIYTVTGANGLCMNSQTVSLMVNPTPTVVANSSPSIICSGSSSTLTANGASTYTWSPGALTGSNVVVTPTASTIYTVTGDNLGCSNTVTLSLIVNPTPTVSVVSSPTIFCLGSTSTLTANGALTYTWQPGGLNTATIINSNTITTTYTLIGASGTCTNSTTITVAVNPLPSLTVNATPTVVCAGSNVTLTAAGAVNYTWNPMGAPGATIVSNPTVTTTYTVIGDNIFGCTNQTIVTVSVNPTPTITAVASPTSVCLGATATLTASGGNTYTWNPGALNGTVITVSPTLTTTYTLVGQDLIGCSSTQTIQLVVLPIPTITAVSNPTAICIGSSATLTANGALTYTWQPGNIVTATTVVNPTITTVYTLTGSNGICGSGLTTLTLVVNDLPANVTASVSGIITCASPSVNLLGSTTSTNVGYLWNGPGGYTAAVQNPTGIAIPGTYTFTVFNLNGGCSTSATVAVTTDSSVPTTSVTINGTITCSNPSATLTAATSATNAGFNWTGPTPFTSTLQTNTVSVGGNYTLTVTDLNSNCVSSTVVTIMSNTYVPITATIIPATCNGTLANNNAQIIVSGFVPGDKNDYCLGITYTGTATYTNATAIPITGIITSTLNNPLSITPYTLRFFGANGCIKDTTLFLTPTSCITNTVFGIAKAVSTPTLKPNGTYDINYFVVVKNSGIQDLNDISLIENLSNTFPLPTTYSIISPPLVTSLGSSITIDGTFDGSVQAVMTNSATSKLAAGKTDTIMFSLNINPKGLFGPFKNTVFGFASPTLGVVFADSSNTGYDVDPDGDGKPTNNNLPTILNLQPNLFFGLTKEGELSEKLPDNTYDVSYTITVHNLGNDTLSNITVKDSLFHHTIKQPATYTLKSGPTTNGNLTANGAYNGNSDVNLIIASQSKLPPGAVRTIVFSINVNPDTVTVIKNSAYGNAINSTSIAVSDTSNNGTNPDINNNGVWNESADNIPTVLSIPNTSLFVPNGFSPNGDGKNDVWFIKGLPSGVENYVTIYNRWGNKVYQKGNYDNNWSGYPNVSGTLGHEKLPQGTYYYIIEFKGGNLKPLNGFVVLQY